MLMKLRRSAAIVLSTVLVTASVTASVTACSDDDSDQAEGTSSSNASYPLTVSTALGDVEIPAEPEDIVTLGDPAFENLAALDVEPTAALVQEKMLAEEYMAEYRDADYMDDRLGVTGREIDIERVASYEPDLIIAPAWPGYADEKVRGQLEEIAPVLLIDEQSSGAHWQTGFTQVAEAVNRTEEAEQKLDEISGSLPPTVSRARSKSRSTPATPRTPPGRYPRRTTGTSPVTSSSSTPSPPRRARRSRPTTCTVASSPTGSCGSRRATRSTTVARCHASGCRTH